MAVFRVEKNRGYTVMSNHHLRNKALSLKAKGLLSQMCAGLKNDSQRGLVEMAVTKHLTVLQALLDWQAQSKHLSIYV